MGDLYNENIQSVILTTILVNVFKNSEYKIKYNKEYLEKSISEINNIVMVKVYG